MSKPLDHALRTAIGAHAPWKIELKARVALGFPQAPVKTRNFVKSIACTMRSIKLSGRKSVRLSSATTVWPAASRGGFHAIIWPSDVAAEKLAREVKALYAA
ncbi:hypothetical protein AB4874_05380 [Thioclava sp. 15-R06ZXC-3]|uniref:Uncharacterized protein n=1 Tax=Thioclava arctica TaxID=3238301 RepID=A0ABV3THS4_9RHOB